MADEVELEAALRRALQRIQELKMELEAARAEARLQMRFNLCLAGFGSAEKPSTTVTGGGSNAAPLEPGGREGETEKTTTETDVEMATETEAETEKMETTNRTTGRRRERQIVTAGEDLPFPRLKTAAKKTRMLRG